jgi:hypothetical protein
MKVEDVMGRGGADDWLVCWLWRSRFKFQVIVIPNLRLDHLPIVSFSSLSNVSSPDSVASVGTLSFNQAMTNERCPGCRKWYINLPQHVKRSPNTRCQDVAHCSGCNRWFIGLQQHLDQSTDPRCQAVRLAGQAQGDNTSQGGIPVEPEGDLFGAYRELGDDDFIMDDTTDYHDYISDSFSAPDTSFDSERPTSPIPSSSVPPSPIPTYPQNPGTARDFAQEEELAEAAAAFREEGGWEPSPSPSPQLSHPPFPTYTPSSPQSTASTDPQPSPPWLLPPSFLEDQPEPEQIESRSPSPPFVINPAEWGETLPPTPYQRISGQPLQSIRRYPDPRAGAPIQVNGRTTNDRYKDRMANSINPYFPFASRVDWLLAKWAKERGPSSTALAELLAIPEVSSRLAQVGSLDTLRC